MVDDGLRLMKYRQTREWQTLKTNEFLVYYEVSREQTLQCRFICTDYIIKQQGRDMLNCLTFPDCKIN